MTSDDRDTRESAARKSEGLHGSPVRSSLRSQIVCGGWRLTTVEYNRSPCELCGGEVRNGMLAYVRGSGGLHIQCYQKVCEIAGR
jgi:hypothetical protein